MITINLHVWHDVNKFNQYHFDDIDALVYWLIDNDKIIFYNTLNYISMNERLRIKLEACSDLKAYGYEKMREMWQHRENEYYLSFQEIDLLIKNKSLYKYVSDDFSATLYSISEYK